jgi:dipeptidyl aminopeptidase/acylaminoacyl peptidase
MIKYPLLPLVIGFTLFGCISTTTKVQPSTTLATEQSGLKSGSPAYLAQTKESSLANNQITIKLEKIMSDPDWMGRSPESWYWGDNSETVFYQQKRQASPLRDLFSQSIDEGDVKKTSQPVKLAEIHKFADNNAQRDKTNTKEVYTFKGNVYVKNLVTKQTQQLTHTSAIEYNAMFLNNGDVAYRVNNSFYSQQLDNNRLVELAVLKTQADPKEVNLGSTYIENEQAELIDYIALQNRNKALRNTESDRLKAANSTVTQNEFYLGADTRIVHASLSPNGDKLIVSIADSQASRSDTDIMPNYVAKSGDIKSQQVRARVADNRQYSEELWLLDLVSGQKFSLSYQVLPGFDEDVLSAERRENFQRQGKTYKTQKSPRNIHVMQTFQPIKWHPNGQQVALLLEAWDNKDRWLARVNLLENSLESQHRLHDQAWINWTFNEFGWLGNTTQLYYLSEESGYSHLYLKSLKGSPRQLTSGAFEVSDVTLTNDNSRFIFKANKKHPGIYEIYQLDLNSDNITALTNLGGMNSYSLSPDQQKLLIEHSTVTMPPELYVKHIASSTAAVRITHTVSDEFLSMPWTAPSIVAIPSSYQDEPVYSRVYLPDNSSQVEQDSNGAELKNRAVMFSHGAGYLQNSHLGWSGYFREFMFHSLLAQQGYVVIDMDYRASKGYGRDWRTAIYRHMGKPEVEDMRDGVNWLVENANVDRQRIGTYGGSYGGFLTLMSMFTQPDLFQAGSAIRLVSDWAYYNHGYTSNILNTPADDAIAYERSSPIYFAEGLEKPLLINAPMVDDNVFFQDTVRLVQRLIELEKQNFETAIYPVEPHGFVQPSSWLDEYRRIFKLFENNL